MALTVSSPRVFNGNVGKKEYNGNSNFRETKCLCCPYGYHINLDFVEYCEAVAAGNTDKNTVERRKKREKRRQSQSMEILLGLVSPTPSEIDNELSSASTAQPASDRTGPMTLPRSGHTKNQADGPSTQPTATLDLSDVVGDFEATLKRLSKPKKGRNFKNQQIEQEGALISTSAQITPLVDSSQNCDAASVGSENSNISTGTLQNIREQMALSLERMKELEEQVKAIPMLQVQVSVLKEEKRNLQKQVTEFNRSRIAVDDSVDSRLRSQSFSAESRSRSTPTRDIGVMCGVMTRDVGVSHQQVRKKDAGVATSTPLHTLSRSTDVPILKINDTDLEFRKNSLTSSPNFSNSTRKFFETDSSMSLSRLSQSSETSYNSPEVIRKACLNRSPINVDNILPDTREFQDFSTNTESPLPRKFVRSELRFENISPETAVKVATRTCATETVVKMGEIQTSRDVAFIVDDAIRLYQKTVLKEKASKAVQCSPAVPKEIAKRHQEVQVTEPFRMRSNVGITVKPKTSEAGTTVGPGPDTRSIATGPDPVSVQTLSLNSMNSRSHSFNYGDTKVKRKTSKSIGVTVEGLVKTSTRSTDTCGLAPKLREFGTSPIKKKFVDVSVGDSLKPHISISCAANYCDNCKETIKSLAKQISTDCESSYKYSDNQTSNSKIPRLHVSSNLAEMRKQLKRRDTYTKIPTGLIRYDADNKESYDTSNRLEPLGTEESTNKKDEPKEILPPVKDITVSDEKTPLTDSALFEPIRNKAREKKEPSKEMKAAMKVLNDNLKKSPSRNVSHQTKNATNVIQQEWFTVSSTASANPLDVEDYLDCFEECSSFLLEFIVNLIDSSGNTAMHYAVSHGNFDVVSILLDSKVCDINKANAAGYTAVMLAALAEVRSSTHASVVSRLFQLADVNIKAKLHGQTALMLAVSHGRKDMTRLLLDAGAAVNIQDEDGSTALMCAAEHGHTDIVRILLAHSDCDSSIVDVDGSSALKIALEAGNRDIGVLLYAHEHVNRGTSPFASMRRSRKSSKTSTPTSPSAPTSPAPSRRFHLSGTSLPPSKYSGK